MNDFADFRKRDLRLVLLRSLLEQPGFRSNDNVLAHEARVFGLDYSRDAIKAELRWLESIGAVKIVEAGSVLVATITRRGEDHVSGRFVIDGVNRPAPEA
jgi:hypothetical protein